MTWICISCKETVGKDEKLSGIIPSKQGHIILCEECKNNWEPRDR